ncbi:MAG: hypothetical protein ACE5NN_05290 [Candidatus Bathyarchaeia archaeon]
MSGDGGEAKEMKATVYFRGEEEKALYEEAKRVAGSYGFSFSDWVKLLLEDPKKALKVMGKWIVKDGYGLLDAYISVMGGTPDRDRLLEEAWKMSPEDLLEAIRATKEIGEKLTIAMRHYEICREVYPEVYREKMKKIHGVVVDEIKL